MDGAEDHDRADELAKKTSQLNDSQRKQFEKDVSLATDLYGRVTDKYRLDVVNTLLQPLTPIEQARQIKEAGRREGQRAYLNDQRDARAGSAPETSQTQLAPERAVPGQDDGKRKSSPDFHNGPSQPHATPRDYGELRRTHELVAAKQNAERGAARDTTTGILSKEQLQFMAERHVEARRAGNLEPTQSELREHSELAKMQLASQEKLDRAHGSEPNAEQKQERALLDHQHLAERVGTEARMIGQQLRKQGNPGAESVEREGRNAFQTARTVHEQRQHVGADRVSDAARAVLAQDQQKQATAQEAERGGSALTSEQRANASPDVKQTLDRKERSDTVRATGIEEKFQGARQDVTKSGNARSSQGRSR